MTKTYRIELTRVDVLVILAALASFSEPPTDYDDDFRVTATNLADYLRAETRVGS